MNTSLLASRIPNAIATRSRLACWLPMMVGTVVTGGTVLPLAAIAQPMDPRDPAPDILHPTLALAAADDLTEQPVFHLSSLEEQESRFAPGAELGNDGAAVAPEPQELPPLEDGLTPAPAPQFPEESAAVLPLGDDLPVDSSPAATPPRDDVDSSPAVTDKPSPSLPSAKPETEDEAIPTARQQQLIHADRLFRQGRYLEAEVLYRDAKGQSFTQAEERDRPQPYHDPALLPPGADVYWREALAGQESQLESRILVPLNLLTQAEPAFIPGHLLYAEMLMAYDRPEDAVVVLERAANLYPQDEALAQARVETLAAHDQWLEASIAARQFALLNPESALATTMQSQADQYLARFQSRLRNRLRANAIANVVTGAIGYALTGGLFGPFSALETTLLMARGESAVGSAIANQALRQLDIVEDEEVVAYVNEIGQALAALAGRDDFEYEFYVVRDESLNAFALPGGKIFINAGAILHAQSEAELAGLIAHELGHAVLSHGFQLVTQGNLTANLMQVVPYGGLGTNLLVLSYSREMERQADEFGTRLLASSDYAADGLYNLMVTLAEQSRDRPRGPAWLSTHPDTRERLRNMSTQIQTHGFNPYRYEGVERHLQMQARVAALFAEDAPAVTPSPKKPAEL